jgi:hypothetical protein
MRWIRTAALVAALGLLSASSVGQERAPAPTPSPTTTPPPATAGQAPAAPRPPVKDDEFIPTEEISADEQVTFPVDI